MTDCRLVIGAAQFYALSQLVSVERGTREPNRQIPVMLLMMGLAIGVAAFSTGEVIAGAVLLAVGLGMAAGGVHLLTRLKPGQFVRIVFSSGERCVVSDTDERFIDRVYAALREATIAGSA